MSSSKNVVLSSSFNRKAMPIAVGALVFGLSSGAFAFRINTDNPDLEMRWDNTIRVNAAWRVESMDDAIGNNPAFDESNYKFDSSGDMVTQRLDLLSEFDVIWRGKYGARISVAGWYDHAYRDSDVKQNPLLADFGFPSSYSNDKYSDGTKDNYHGPYGEILDAFVFAEHTFGDVPVYLKAGQLTTFWGMSLFYPGGIAKDQHPLDGRKGATSPGAEVKEIFLPLQQVNVQTQLTPALSLEAQYYLDWDNTRGSEGGTFLGQADFATDEPDRTGLGSIYDPAGFNVPRLRSLEPEDDHGNWGVNVKYSPDWLRGQTVGAYYREYDEKAPWVFLGLDNNFTLGFRNMYAEDVKTMGFSFDGQIGAWAVGAELGYHKDAALKTPTFSLVDPTVPDFIPGFADDGARGDAWFGVVNGIYLLGGGWSPWDAGQTVIELSYDRLDKVTENGELFLTEDGKWNDNGQCTAANGFPNESWKDGCATRDAWGLSVLFEPQWLAVLPSLDISTPVVVRTGLSGNSSIANLGVHEDATYLSAGIQFDYKVIHRLKISYDDIWTERTRQGGVQISGNGPDAGLTDRARITLTYNLTL